MSDTAEGEQYTAEIADGAVASAEVGTFPDTTGTTPTVTAVVADGEPADPDSGEAGADADGEDNQSEAETEEDPDIEYVKAEQDLDEIVDNKGHFTRVPPTQKETYPKRSEALAAIKALHKAYEPKRGFVQIDTPAGENGTYLYYVARDYVKKLGEWLQEADDAATEIDLAVDNSGLMMSGSETHLRKGTVDAYRDIVYKDTWEQLIKWFGGGVTVRLKNLETAISFRIIGKLVRCVASTDSSKYRRFYFNGKETVEEMKTAVAKAFDQDPDNCRLHDFFRHKPYTRLDTEATMQTPIAKKQLLHNNLLFLEVKNEKGKYTIKYQQKKAYSPGAGISSYSYYNAGAGYSSYFSKDDSISGTKGPPGIVGLNNLGNTCYMNSIIQCLSNTPLLKEAFLSKAYEADINETNVLGYKGAVAKAFYTLMKFMWSGDGRVVRPAGFKKAINDAKTDFRGYQQHDSQEFLSELLDAMHEDLNRIVNKPSTERVEANGRPDEIVAAESMATYKMRNDSIIADLFTGLYKSTVTCPEVTCGNVSVTFDPYMIVPLPLQEGEKVYQVLQAVFVPLSPEQQPSINEIIVPKHGPVLILRELLKETLGINQLNNEERAAKAKGKFKVSDDPRVSIALGFAEDDDDVVGNRDLLIFNYGVGKLGAKPLDNRGSLGNISKDVRLICFETFDYLNFEYFNYRPTENWKRELNFPRSTVTVATVAETKEDDESKKEAAPEKAKSEKSDGEVNEPLIQQDGEEKTEDAEGEGEGDDENRGSDAQDYNYDNGNSDDEDEQPARVERPEAVEASEEEKIQIGLVGCPLLMGDVWHGRYNHNTDSQHLRIEIVGVEKMDWSAYSNYKAEIIEKYGEQHVDVKLNEKEFESREVFFIHAQADSKEVIASYMRHRPRKQSQFELKGVYITKDPFEIYVEHPQNIPSRYKVRAADVEAENKKNTSGKGITALLKRGPGAIFKRKSRTEDQPEEEPDNLYTFSNGLTPGVLEKKFNAGSFVLRPTENRSVETVEAPTTGYGGYSGYTGYSGYPRTGYTGGYYSNYSYANQDDTSRDPIVLSGQIEKNFRYMWGKFQVDQSYVKGEFTCQRFESMNWNNHKIESIPGVDEQPIMSWSKFPAPLDRDNRILVSICHRMNNAGFRFPFGGIPDSFFVPAHSTECDVMEKIKARYSLYFRKELELAGQPLYEEDPDTGDAIDIVAQRLEGLVVKRATEKFEVRAYVWRGESTVGQELDSQSDSPLNKSSEPYVWLACEWTEYPFMEGRPTGIFNRESKEAKMTLHKALDLFSQVDKLSAMNTWYCNKCKEHKEAYKQLQLWSLPTVLVIQFKRFSQEETRMRADKLEIPVDFPFEIDFTEHTLSSRIAGKSMKKDIEDTNAELSPYDYELVAVSSHIGGGLGSGHYVACAKNENDGFWYDFNDSSVSRISDGEQGRIVNPQAYVLFYVRKTELAKRKKLLNERKQAATTTTEENATETNNDSNNENIVVQVAEAIPVEPGDGPLPVAAVPAQPQN